MCDRLATSQSWRAETKIVRCEVRMLKLEMEVRKRLLLQREFTPPNLNTGAICQRWNKLTLLNDKNMFWLVTMIVLEQP
ncbi:MAG: hypothetical protein CMQ05_15845 [Gammaproteobacteria bacterium]|nr:hypothetical protein [Gammaproteobacteria bacterium]